MAIDQPKTTYSDTLPQKRAITDFIDVIDPDEVPVIKYFGLNGSPGEHQVVNWPETEVEWLEDQLAPIDSSINSGGDVKFTTSGAATSQKVTVADGSLIKTGDVLFAVDTNASEDMILVVSDLSGNNATLACVNTDEWAATKGTLGSKATFDIIGNARTEGADADYERALTNTSTASNYTQIWQEDLRISETANRVQQYGIAKEWDYQVAKLMPHVLRMMERSFFRGRKVAGSATVPRMMGGLDEFLSTNTVSLSGAALTRKDLDDMLQDINEAGGRPTLIICNNWVKRKINAWYEGYVRTERTEDHGGVKIDYIDTEWGTLEVLRSQWCPVHNLYVLQPEYIGWLPLRDFYDEMLAKTGDSIKGQMIGEFTLVVRNEQAHGRISSISTTS